MGATEYELVGWVRRLPLLFAVCFVAGPAVLLGVNIATGGVPAWVLVTRVVMIALGLGLTVWQGFVLPHRVVVDDTGVRLGARLGTTEIPWPDLVVLSHGRFDAGGDQLRWERRSGRAITTSSRFVGLDDMLRQVAQRAPAALATTSPGRRPIRMPGGSEPGR